MSKVFSDNGPQYDSYAFRRFTAEWGFEHVTSSPRYPRSNGFVERIVGIVKPILQKARKSGMDPDMAMLCRMLHPGGQHDSVTCRVTVQSTTDRQPSGQNAEHYPKEGGSGRQTKTTSREATGIP